MQLDLVVLADMANIDGGGKLNIIGEFNMIPAAELPSPAINMALVARIVAAGSEGQQHRVALALVDADGRELARIPDQVLQFGPVVPGTSGRLRSEIFIYIMGAQFPAYGSYRSHALVDGRYLGERTC